MLMRFPSSTGSMNAGLINSGGQIYYGGQRPVIHFPYSLLLTFHLEQHQRASFFLKIGIVLQSYPGKIFFSEIIKHLVKLGLLPEQKEKEALCVHSGDGKGPKRQEQEQIKEFRPFFLAIGDFLCQAVNRLQAVV